MKYAIRYFSKLGHTKKIAISMAEELGIDALSILEEETLKEKVDILFLGGAPYANIMDASLKSYAASLDPNLIGEVILFTTSNWSRRTVYGLKKILEAKGIKVRKEYFYAHMLRIEKRIPAAKIFVTKIKEEEKWRFMILMY